MNLIKEVPCECNQRARAATRPSREGLRSAPLRQGYGGQAELRPLKSARPYKMGVDSELFVGSACLSWIMSLSNDARAAPGGQIGDASTEGSGPDISRLQRGHRASARPYKIAACAV